MASRFWVGGTGNWDASDTTHWSATSGGAGGASVPGTSDTVTFDGSSGGGTVTITATQSVTSITGGAFTGTLNTNGQSITISGAFNFSGSGVRTLTLGASTITCGQWNIAIITNLTFNANTSTITQSILAGSIFLGGGLTYSIVTLSPTATGVANQITGDNTFSTLSITPEASKTHYFTISGNQVISGTLTINGNSSINRVLISSNTIGTSRTLTAATVSVTNADFRDITGAGAGSWNLSAITGLSGDCGGNSGITFTTPANQHWLNVNGGSWSTAANWTSRVPLPQDDVFMDCAFGTSKTVTQDMPRVGKSIDWTGATWTTALIWAMSAATSVFGSLTLISGLTLSGSSTYTFEGRGSYTLDTKGINFARSLTLNAPTGTLTLQENLSKTGITSATLTITNGTFDANNKDILYPSYSFTGGTLIMGSGTFTVTGAGNTWNCTNTTITAGTSTIKFTDSTNNDCGFIGGSKIYNKLWFDRGASVNSLTIFGSNTFAEFKDTGTVAHSILFTAGTTQTIATFNVNGSSGNVITINSTTTGTHALVKAGGGTVSCDYLNIQHSVATPATTWYAGANSVNNQATATAGSGWIFTVPPSGGTSNFLAFMV